MRDLLDGLAATPASRGRSRRSRTRSAGRAAGSRPCSAGSHACGCASSAGAGRTASSTRVTRPRPVGDVVDSIRRARFGPRRATTSAKGREDPSRGQLTRAGCWTAPGAVEPAVAWSPPARWSRPAPPVPVARRRGMASRPQRRQTRIGEHHRCGPGAAAAPARRACLAGRRARPSDASRRRSVQPRDGRSCTSRSIAGAAPNRNISGSTW